MQESLKSDERICPFCAEIVKAQAILCKHCKSNLDPKVEVPNQNAQPVEQPRSEDTSSNQKNEKANNKASNRLLSIVAAPFILIPFAFIDSRIAIVCALLSGVLWILSLTGLLYMKGKRLKCLIIAISSFSGCIFLSSIAVSRDGNEINQLEPEVQQIHISKNPEPVQEPQRQEEKEKEKEKETPIYTGERGIVREQCLGANSEKSLDDYLDSLSKNDHYGLKELMQSGQIAVFEGGEDILLLGTAGFMGSVRKVRVLSGSHTGEIWYFPYEFLSKASE